MSVLTLNSTGKPVNRKVLNFCRNSILGVVNFQKYSVGGYPEQMIDKIWNTVSQDKLNLNSKIAVVNDVCLEATWFLMQKEFSDITLLCTDERIKQYTLNSVNNTYSFDKEITCINVITIEELNTLEQKFDLIIANPPFSIGNDVIRTCLPYCEEAVVLMPGSDYRKKNLHWNVREIFSTSEGSKIFGSESASIVDVTIARLTNEKIKTDYDTQFVLYRYDPLVIKFVKENIKLPLSYTKLCSGGDRLDLRTISLEKTFVVSGRVLDDGVHTKPTSSDYVFNYLKKIPEKPTYGCAIINFPSEICKNNFSKFWYKNPIMNMLLTGAHSSSVRTELNNLIPRIDWSVDRDYEHMSYEELLEIMKDELNKQNKRKDN